MPCSGLWAEEEEGRGGEAVLRWSQMCGPCDVAVVGMGTVATGRGRLSQKLGAGARGGDS